MGEIKDFVELYIHDSDILEDYTNDVARDLQNNIISQLWDGHGYDQGRLKRAIRVDSRFYEKYATIIGTWDEGLAPHGIYVLGGSKSVEGKLMKMPWGYRTKRKAIPPIDFLGDGLKETMAKYGG